MADYSHLDTHVAGNRYVLAARYLKHCGQIVEIGGHRISNFIKDDMCRFYWMVDPAAGDTPRVSVFPVPLLDFNFAEVTKATYRPTGLCLLGLELRDDVHGDGGERSIEYLLANLHRFDAVVMDWVIDNPVASLQFGTLAHGMSAEGMQCIAALRMAFEHDDKYTDANDSFFKERGFRVYKRTT